MISYLYRLVFPNGKIYIGITNNFTKRLNDHKKQAVRGNIRPVYKAIRHFGWEAVRKEILVVGDRQYITDLEISAIASFGALSIGGYNVSPGGEISPMLIESVRVKVGLSRRGCKPSEAARENMRAAQLGRRHSPETIEKLRQINLGRSYSPETIERMRQAKLGTTASPEARERQSAARRGRRNSKETCERISAAVRETMATPEFRERRSEISRQIHTPEMVARKAESVRAAFKDPAVRERHRQGIMASLARRKAKAETEK